MSTNPASPSLHRCHRQAAIPPKIPKRPSSLAQDHQRKLRLRSSRDRWSNSSPFLEPLEAIDLKPLPFHR
jgi:hypothetical protein